MRGHQLSEEGFFLVWMALLLTALMTFAGFGVDVAHWYVEANRIQKAADAAALAGAVYLPADPTTAASTAAAFATKNGFTAGGSNSISVQAVQDPTIPTRLRVTITEQVPNFFGQVIGFRREQITRSATADFQGPIAMGSPANNFGNEPIGTGDTRFSSTYTASAQPNFWGNIFGPQSTKQNGDAKQAGWCDSGSPDGCNAFTRNPGANADYSASGYFYKVTVGAQPSGSRLRIQVFDPAFVDVGDLCDGDPGNHGGNSTLAGATGATNNFVTDASTRYASGQGPYCTGDQLFSGSSGDGTPPLTTYIVRGPVGGTINPDDVPVIDSTTSGQACDPTDGAHPAAGHDPNAGLDDNQFPGFNLDNLTSQLDTNNSQLAQVFRRWVTICTINVTTPGDYYVQVRTNAPLGSPLLSNPNLPGGGANRFAIRAGWINGGNNGLKGGTAGQTNVTIQGNGYMGIFANVPSGGSTVCGAVNSTCFYLARVLPTSAGKTLRVRLFDIGDCSGSGCAPAMKVLDKNGNQYSACVESAGPGSPSNLSPCGFSAGSAFNARWTDIDIAIPANYTCTQTNRLDCWVQITYTPPAGSLLDTTTWGANIEGDPVRLVQ
jgi:hypothetical protein